MRRSSAENDSLDWGLARSTGFAFAIINPVPALEIAGKPVAVAVIPQGAAAMAKGLAKGRLDGSAQPGNLLGG